jgi:hypothetical protein
MKWFCCRICLNAGGGKSTPEAIQQNTSLNQSQQMIAIKNLRGKGYLSLEDLTVKTEKVKEAVSRTA